MVDSKTRISIVEDDPAKLRELQEKIAQTEDLSCVDTLTSAEDALARIPQTKPDIVLMDIGLPHMNGVECMYRLKQKCPNTVFLMYTVFLNDEHVFDALKFGAAGYVLKREGASGVVRAVREIRNGGAPMSPEIAKKVIKSFQISTDEDLTPREVEILGQLSKGLQNKEIAEKLYITVGTVKVQLARIYKKLQVNNRVEAVNKFRRT